MKRFKCATDRSRPPGSTISSARQIRLYGKLILTISIVLFVCITACAKRGNPGGGPKDETPPFVSVWEPIQGSQEVAPETWVSLEWNEPVDRATVREHLVVSPDTSELEWKWDDMTLHIRPRGGWMDAPVQWILVGEGIVDRHDLRSDEPFYLWFTTKDSLVPTSVKGTLLLAGGDVPARGALIAVNDSTGQPVWRLVSSEDGTFEMHGLPSGYWFIRAHLDTDKNRAYDRGVEPWSESSFAVTMDSTLAVSISLAIEDTIPPKVVAVRAPHQSLLRIGMSEPVLVNESTIFTLNDTAGTTYGIESINSSLSTPGMVDLYLSDPMRDDEMRIFVSAVRDTMGLYMADTTVSFMGTSLSDTVAPSIERFWYGEEEIWPISVVFSEAVNESVAAGAFEVVDLEALSAIPGSIVWLDPTVLSWSPSESIGSENVLVRFTGNITDRAGNVLPEPLYRSVPAPEDSLLPPWEPMPRFVRHRAVQ